jgi:hypothetical protein
MTKIFHAKYEAVFFCKILMYVREHMTRDEISAMLDQIEAERKKRGEW